MRIFDISLSHNSEGERGYHTSISTLIANLSLETLLQNDVLINPVAKQHLEKAFTVNLRSQNPDSIKCACFSKFVITFLLANRRIFKGVYGGWLDIVRNVITGSKIARVMFSKFVVHA